MRLAGAFALSLALLLFACAGRGSTPKREASVLGPPISYSFGTVDGAVVDSERHRGRVTVLLFVTTFDVFSQAAAKRLEDAFRSHVPRINALAVVMEAPQYVDLARSFRDVLELSYPVAIEDKRELQRQGVLSMVQGVPAWIFLNERGQVFAGGSGALSLSELEKTISGAGH